MNSRGIKLPDGCFARPTVSRLEVFLKNSMPLVGPTGAFVPPLPESPPSSPRQLPDYHTRDFDPERLQGKEVTIFGAGSVGSYLAYFLAIARLIFHVIDSKRVEYKHIRDGRTIYDSTAIGLFKVDALKRKVEADRLGTSVKTYPLNVAEITTQDLRVLFQRSLLVVLAIDDPKQLLRISDLAYPMVELIQVAMHREALSGHIAVSIPFVTPCLRCTLGINSSQDIHRLDSERGNSLDIANVAQQAARIAVDILCSKVTGRPTTRWDNSKNLIYVANTREELSPDGPGLHFEASQRRPGCAICSPLQGR